MNTATLALTISNSDTTADSDIYCTLRPFQKEKIDFGVSRDPASSSELEPCLTIFLGKAAQPC